MNSEEVQSYQYLKKREGKCAMYYSAIGFSLKPYGYLYDCKLDSTQSEI